ncbi:HlyD family secretion protein [Thalassovita mangrovi]|uniref:HlyD family efflux transporter periplasmic adaptor subunit n=1 Tax=Thalassovita mangrovi TaxID=2692236 RepID=A0A6L8LMV8_9RHOB|nr:HlyD family efflux transporter periplasmic adaptor subunit [Thalassovita mangrovi]MYM56873.1 HlyD family efflux transporter periplasmic adaptor subunit [Thalassovita mangrovi]
MRDNNKKWGLIGLAIAIAAAGYFLWGRIGTSDVAEGIAYGNGRIEATEIDISALAGGRISEILPQEGDFVKAGDVLVQMDITLLTAQKRQAEAQLKRAQIGIETAKALVAQAEAQERAAAALVDQARAAADAAASRLARSKQLKQTNVISQQVLDDDLATDLQAKAGLASAEASQAAATAGVGSAKAQVVDAEAAVEAAQAAIEAIQSSIDDATLRSPRDGRVQYRIAQEGEVVGAGSRILNLVDLADVYMTFFLPTPQAGRVQVGQEVRIVMDTLPDMAVPATVSYVADVAQFTPKTVETVEEREKLMFRVRARVDPALLQTYIEYVKTGLPGMAYLRIDPEVEWPAFLSEIVK